MMETFWDILPKDIQLYILELKTKSESHALTEGEWYGLGILVKETRASLVTLATSQKLKKVANKYFDLENIVLRMGSDLEDIMFKDYSSDLSRNYTIFGQLATRVFFGENKGRKNLTLQECNDCVNTVRQIYFSNIYFPNIKQYKASYEKFERKYVRKLKTLGIS